ncbi:hypothetical protein N7486_006767 [Penicillium sp. IBT 16267x]|nr:hypothetical protein N7486_006767 [Penicillium sp. IBT 16267x]
MQQENQTPASKATGCRKKCQANDQLGRGVDNPQEMKTPLISPTMTRLSGLGLDMRPPHIQPGNAFALLKPIGPNGSNLPRRSSGKPIGPHSSTLFTPSLSQLTNALLSGGSDSTSPNESVNRPPMLRKMSSLDYDEALALPMPKPRHIKPDSGNTSNPFENDNERPNFLKKRFATDPVVSLVHARSEPVSLQDNNEGKKKSRFEMIKSKLSFKDLRKELVKEDLAVRQATPPHRAFTASAIPTLASNSQGSSMKTNIPSCKKDTPPTMAQPSSLTALNHSTKNPPLPSSGTLSKVSEPTPTITRERSCRSSATSSAMECQAPSSMSSFTIKEETSPVTSTPTPIVPERRRPGIAIPRSTSATPTRKLLSPSTVSVPIYPVTKDSPPNLSDLTEREGKVKYLPKTWVDGSYRLISDGNKQTLSPTVYAKGESPVTSLYNYLPSFKERLDKLDLSPPETSLDEGQSRSTANQIDDILGMIKSIQRRVDGGVANMNKKLEELCAWIGDQLQNQITSNGDLSRANSDLFSKQCQISREMMKFQLDIRLEIGTMERRLSTFENNVVDELQNEVRSLARSYKELNHKTQVMIAKHSFNDNQSFIEQQVQKNGEIEREIAYLKAHQGTSISQDIAPLAPQKITSQRSFSSNDSSEPLIKGAVLLVPPPSPEDVRTTPRHAEAIRSHVLTTPNHVLTTPKRIQSTPKEAHPSQNDISVTPSHPRVDSMVENKAGSLLPRSVSLSGKGIIKGIKDIASSTPCPKENKEKTHLNKTKSNDESKKWNLFGMRNRRRDDSNSTSSSSKFYWSPRPRRPKDVPNNEEATISSRSSTPPVPPIPRNVPPPGARKHVRSIERIPTPFPSSVVDQIYSVHPAFRGEHRGPNGVSGSSFETAPESLKGVDVDIMEQKILDGSVSAFAEPPSLDFDDGDSNVPLLGTLTPKLKTREHVIEDASPSTAIRQCSGGVQKDMSSTDTLQDWDHVMSL